MLLQALTTQLEQRFQHEKRAQVCLWFDEKREFLPLMPAFDQFLAEHKQPPFSLLVYDAEQSHGQIWLKRCIATALKETPSQDRKQLRFVLYVPLSEDRLDGPDGDEPGLDLLVEYRIAGTMWRIDGKRPTLFSFLRRAGAALPTNPAEQRRLYEGGEHSILAKYVTKFADRPVVFWETTLTPELAQARLIGDIDQTILDLAVSPETTWSTLTKNGLEREFLDLVRERYGFEEPNSSPAEWVEGLVTVLALTETSLGYGQPADFPFSDRLPPVTLRRHHAQLLARWLRDSESRGAWDQWIQEVEAKLDLSAWAKGKQGLSFGFPHLVQQRWRQTLSVFEQAVPKASTTTAFFAQYSDLIAKEAEFSKASLAPVGSWSLLRDLGDFVTACDYALTQAEQAHTTQILAAVYIEYAATVEKPHLMLRSQAEEQSLPSVAHVADRAYASYANTLNARFFEQFAKQATAELPGIPPVTPHLEAVLWNTTGRRAVVLVDALRYDCALSIAELLRDIEVKVEPVCAVMPTVTPVGMTALLPLSKMSVGIEIKANSLHPRVNGKDMAARDNRKAFLLEFGAACYNISDVEALSEPPASLGPLLAVFGHEEFDQLGHASAETLIRHVHLEIQRLARLIRKLHRWGYPTVHVVTDHGFLLLDEDKLPDEVRCDKDWCHVRKERFALVPASADLPLATFPFAWDVKIKVAVPPGLAFFSAEKSFSHGGAALQELVIPHLVSKSQMAQEKKVGVEVVLPTFELMRTAVKVTLRPKTNEPGSGQMALFTETKRTLRLDVLRPSGEPSSVLAAGAKEVELTPQDTEQNVTLFFHTAASFQKGELLHLDIRDMETAEQFPPGGITLSVGRDM